VLLYDCNSHHINDNTTYLRNCCFKDKLPVIIIIIIIIIIVIIVIIIMHVTAQTDDLNPILFYLNFCILYGTYLPRV